MITNKELKCLNMILTNLKIDKCHLKKYLTKLKEINILKKINQQHQNNSSKNNKNKIKLKQLTLQE